MFIFPYQIFSSSQKHLLVCSVCFAFRLFPPRGGIFYFFWASRTFSAPQPNAGNLSQSKEKYNLSTATRPTDRSTPKKITQRPRSFFFDLHKTFCHSTYNNFDWWLDVWQIGGRGWQLEFIHQEQVGLEIELESASITKHRTNITEWTTANSLQV